MLALFLTPLSFATLLSSTEIGPFEKTFVRFQSIQDTVVADSAPKAPREIAPIDLSVPMLNLDMVKRLGAVKKGLEPLARKHPELGGGALGIAMQSKSFGKFEKSEPFGELTKEHGFTVKDFFAAYSEVVGGLFILNVEKKLNQRNLTEAQGYKVIPPNKNFLIKHRKLIQELKLDDSYVGERPRDPFGRGGGGRSNPMNPMNPSPTTPSLPSNPMDPSGDL